MPENFRNCGTVSTKKGVNNSFQWSRAGTAQARAKSYFRRDVPGADKTRDLRATNGAIFWHLYWQFISLVYQKYTLSSLKREPEREKEERKKIFLPVWKRFAFDSTNSFCAARMSVYICFQLLHFEAV